MIKKLLFTAMFSASIFSFAQEKFSIIPSVGFGWRTAENPEGLTSAEEDYIKGLKSGVNFDISAYYHLKGTVALGLKFSNYSASSTGQLSGTDQNGNLVYFTTDTKDNITYFGPSVMISNFNENTRHKGFVDISLGVISYTTKSGNVKGTGSNFGAEMNLAYQYEVSKFFYIGPKLGLTGGTLNKMKYNGQTFDFGDNKEGLSRVSLSAAATFRF